MIAIDTNILVYAHREDSPHHDRASELLRELVRGTRQVAVPWPCLHEFLAVVTHPRMYAPPSTMSIALRAVESLAGASNVQILGEQSDHLPVLSRLLESGVAVGPRVHDARIAAICLSAGVTALWSADRDFSWFPALRVVNPLVDGTR